MSGKTIEQYVCLARLTWETVVFVIALWKHKNRK